MKKNIFLKHPLRWTASVLFLIAVIAIFYPGLSGPFLLDDLQSIEPTQMRLFNWDHFFQICLQNQSGPLGRPISIASFALNNYWLGMEPFGFKAVNLAIHLVVGVTLALFIYLLLSCLPRLRGQALAVALMTAALWLIHPLQVSTVLYPVQRMTQLCDLFILLGINTYLWGRIRLNLGKRYGLTLMIVSLTVYFPMALLSKETGALFPWYLFCVEYFLLGFRTPNARWSYYLKHFHILLSLTILFVALFYYQQHLSAFLSRFAEKNITLFERLFTEADVLLLYLKMILLPRLSDMSLYHDDFKLSTTMDWGSLGIAVLFAIMLILKRRAPIISFGLGWFFISHVIESTILPLELVFEHRNYLASAGILLIPTYYFVQLLHHPRLQLRYPLMGFGLIIIVMLAGITMERAYTWSTPERFLASEVLYHPNSPRVHLEIANWHLSQFQYNQAFSELDKAAALQPYNAGIALHRLLIHCHARRIPDELYDQVGEKLRQGAITPYVIMIFNAMVSNMFNHQCDAMDKAKLLQLLTIASQNPFVKYHSQYQAVLFHLQAGVVLLENNPVLSRKLLLQSYASSPKRLDPLIEKAYLEIHEGLLDEAGITLDVVQRQVKKHPFLLSSDKVRLLEKAYQHARITGVAKKPALRESTDED